MPDEEPPEVLGTQAPGRGGGITSSAPLCDRHTTQRCPRLTRGTRFCSAYQDVVPARFATIRAPRFDQARSTHTHARADRCVVRLPLYRSADSILASIARSVLASSPTGSCRPRGIDPWAYLVDGLARINDHPAHRASELTRAAWAGE